MLTSVEIRDAVLMALSALRANKFRSFLTILGVMIGVSSVIALASVVNGLDKAVEEEIETTGATSIIEIERFPPGTDWDNLTDEERRRPEMTAEEAWAIKTHCPSIDGVAPMNHHWERGSEGNVIKYSSNKVTFITNIGTWPDYLTVKSKSLSRGRFINETDVDLRAPVVVIGHDIAENLFEKQDPIGKEVRLNGDRMTVIGVFEDVESNFGDSYENKLAAIPLSTYEKLHPDDEALTLYVKAQSIEVLEQAKEEIIAVLRIQRKVPFDAENNFALSTQDTWKERAANITKYIYFAMIIITSVGLMVGGIGVMNIMLVSVTERTREIGVRKAIGAKRSNIILQFLTEAMTLSGFGGVIGIGFGVVSGLGINALLNAALGFGFPLTVPMFWVFMGFVVSVSVGLVSGVYPAFKAARLDPIESLRYE